MNEHQFVVRVYFGTTIEQEYDVESLEEAEAEKAKWEEEDYKVVIKKVKGVKHD